MRRVSSWQVSLLLACIAGACSVNTSPEMPTWEASFNIPLGTETFTLEEWIEDSDELSEDASGLIAFHFDGTVDRAEVGDRLKIDPIDEEFQASIGSFELNAPARQEAEFQFTDVWPPAAALEGQSAPVPGFQFVDLEGSFPEFDSFQSMTLEKGILTVVVWNDLPVDIEDVEVVVVDEATALETFTLSLASIPAAAVDSVTTDLAGVTLSSNLTVKVSGGSPGSNMEFVPISAGAGLEVAADLSGLVAVSATADLPTTEIELEETTEIPEGIVLTEAEIARGRIDLQFTNDLPVNLSGLLVVEEFLDPAGSPLAVDLDIPAEGPHTCEVPLSGYTLRPQPASGQCQFLTVAASVTSEESDGAVTVDSQDGISVVVSVDTLSLYRVAGVLDSTSFDIEPNTMEVDFPDDLDAISLVEASLTLQIISNISFPVLLSLEAVGRSDKGTVVTLPIEAELGAGAKSTDDTTVVILNQDNSTIVTFLNNLPQTVSFSGRARVGDGSTEGTVTQEDYVQGSYEFGLPFYLAIEEQNIETDLTEIEVLPENGDADGGDGAVDGELTRRMKSAELWVTFYNHTPFGVVATAFLATDSTRVFSDPDLALDAVNLIPGVVDETDAVVEASAADNRLALSEEDLDLFRNPGDQIKRIYLGTRVQLMSTEGRPVKVRSSDYFQTAARICLTAKVDTDNEGS